ncbi:CoA transferase [Paraburkholderia phymatum]|uniref:L-carnitine dehydratase/bile acid-inducible protein F n=1 Tax=Paraburkholderia phymatum (strain DSM 17167 / CIP 108236 / LMG 21445 / STM815) TaxID=391038 RepID=B2JDW7_PARP8|nr:CoA transferase [Paraburkholderia phymatum]ACC69743.1 L-carnitine dehydratase/bile acid-inducible protein F [Paraburkholderia phymatum STM815]
MTPQLALDHLWSVAGCDAALLEHVSMKGDDPALPSVFRVGTLASASIAAMALAAANCFRLRTGLMQHVDVSVRRALIAFRSERYLRVNDGLPQELRHPVTGFYATRDGRWIQLHTNFPHHLQGVLKVLGCDGERDAVVAAIRNWDGAQLDQTLAEAGLCAALIRSPREWAALDQAKAIANLPLLEIERIGDAPPEAPGRGAATRPLTGTRVLDLSRIIAGPVAGRALAQHGADVLLINGPHLPNIAPLVIDNGRGKRSATLDLRDAAAREQLQALAGEADVFLEAYRPGSLAARGFDPGTLARARPGIVCVSISAYGRAGPWATRRGFDSLVQSASGIAFEESRAAAVDGPKHLPCQALDHATGYLAAFGAMVALARRAHEGGSWHVRLSLAQTGRWLQSMGQIKDGWRTPDVTFDEVQDGLQEVDSPFGRVHAAAPAERMSQTPAFYARPPVPIGTDTARWEA